MHKTPAAKSRRGETLIAIREMVLRGEFAGPKRIEEAELSKILCASRPAVHTALETLTHEGLVEESPAGGFVARHFTYQDISDAIAARGALEGLAAGLAAARISDPGQLDDIRRISLELAGVTASFADTEPPTAEQMARFGELNAAFHTALVALAHSPMLQLSVKRVQSIAFASPAAVVVPGERGGFSRAVEDHAAILDAIEAHDAARAEALTREHARFALRGLRSTLTRSGDRPAKARELAQGYAANAKSVTRSRTGSRRTGASARTAVLILDAAADLFCEKGFSETTTREIAARLNIHQASLYFHIAGKEDLLYRISKLVIESMEQRMHSALGNGNPGERLGVFIDAHLQGLFENRNRTMAAMVESRSVAGARGKELALMRSRYSDLLNQEIEAAARAGLLRRDIPPLALRLALLNYLNWTPRWFRTSGPLGLEQLGGIYECVFREGVAAPGQPRLSLPRIRPLRRGRSDPAHGGTLGKFLRTAAELFSRQGYSSTSTRAISTFLGMEKATLYYHVESKEDLLYLICKSSFEMLHADMERALEGITCPLEELAALIQAQCISLLRDQTQHATALAEVRALSPERLAEIVSTRKGHQNRVRGLIQSGQKAGVIRRDVESRYLASMLQGLLERTVVWYRKGGGFPPGELAGYFAETFLFGARAPA
ncbi:MAG TPA: TetR family transcriptional regulator [Bryobacteraceae bacterium]|jgi:GntR family transcriptional regulator of vanillate catabolism